MKSYFIIYLLMVINPSFFQPFQNNEDIREKSQQAEWEYKIKKLQVGSLKIGMQIKDIQSIIPSNYKIVEKFIRRDGTYDEPEDIVYDLYNNNCLEFRIYPHYKDDNIVEAIVVYSSDYYIDGTNINVGCLVKEINKHYVYKDYYFDLDVGIYLEYENFPGSFSIERNLEELESLEEIYELEISKIIISTNDTVYV